VALGQAADGGIAGHLADLGGVVGHQQGAGAEACRRGCGLGPRVGDAQIAWAKFEAMAEGARLATKELWGR